LVADQNITAGAYMHQCPWPPKTSGW